MFVSPIAAALTLFVLAGCCLAFWKGGQAERIGAGVILGNLLLLFLADRVQARASAGVFGLVVDGLTAIGMLVIVLRYASRWLGGVMLLYGAQFTLHSFYFVTERPFDRLHAMINNANFVGVMICLVAGTVFTWRRRVVAERSTAR